jgi:hypothetical protein
MDSRVVGLWLRGTWAAAQYGERAFELAVPDWRRPCHPMAMMLSSLTLATVARRHPGLLFPVGRVFVDGPAPSKEMPREAIADLVPTWRNAMRRAMNAPEKVGRELVALTRDAAWNHAPYEEGLWPQDEIPEEIARGACASLDADVFYNARNISLITAAPAWLGDARAEDLYVPAAHMDTLVEEWSPELALGWYRHLKRYDPGRRPVVREAPRVGRNEPCACGSGRKLKKCCG